MASVAPAERVAAAPPAASLNDVGTLIVEGTDGYDVIGVLRSGDDVFVSLAGRSQRFDAAAVRRVSVSGLGGEDTISLLALTVPADVDGGAGTDSLSCGSRGGEQGVSADAITFGGVVTHFSEVETLWVAGAGGADAVTFAGAAGGPRTIVELLGGNDTVAVTSGDPDRPLVIRGGAGDDAVTLVAAADLTQRGSVSFDGEAGADTFTARGTPAADTITVDRNGFSGIGTGSTTSVETLLVDASGGADVINLLSSDSRRATTLDGGAGIDLFNVGTAASGFSLFAGDVTVRGGADSDSIRVDDRADARGQAYRLTPDSFSRWLRGTIDYGGVEVFQLATGSGPDRIVATPSATTMYNLNAGAPKPPPTPPAAGDDLGLVFDGATGVSKVSPTPGWGAYTFADRRPVLFAGVEQFDDVQPGVSEFEADLSSGPGMALKFTLNKPLSSLDAGSVVITNSVTQEVWAATPQVRYDVGTRTATFDYAQQPPPGRYTVSIGGRGMTDELGNPFSFTSFFSIAKVLQRLAFYNGSHFDGDDAAADARDDGAIATDKAALLPGRVGSFNNVITDTAGITGVMIDVAYQPFYMPVTPEEFDVRVGDARVDPANWAEGPRPDVTVRPGAGLNGSYRVSLTWGDNLIRNTWLQVTVKSSFPIGLASPDVFYFGSLVGETGYSGAGARLKVTAVDVAAVKRATNTDAAVTSRLDFNRDGRVDALDLAAVRANLNRRLAALAAPLPAAPASPFFARPAADPLATPAPARPWDEPEASLLA